MYAPGLVEHGERQTRNLLRVLGPIAAALGQLDDAAAPDVGYFAGLGNVLPIPLDVVQYESFTKRQIAKGNFGGLELPQDLVEEDAAGHDQIGAARIQTRQLHSVHDVARGELLP